MEVMFEDSIYTTTLCTHVRAREYACVCANRVRQDDGGKKKIPGEKNNSGDYYPTVVLICTSDQMILINTSCFLQHKFVCFYGRLLWSFALFFRPTPPPSKDIKTPSKKPVNRHQQRLVRTRSHRRRSIRVEARLISAAPPLSAWLRRETKRFAWVKSIASRFLLPPY